MSAILHSSTLELDASHRALSSMQVQSSQTTIIVYGILGAVILVGLFGLCCFVCCQKEREKIRKAEHQIAGTREQTEWERLVVQEPSQNVSTRTPGTKAFFDEV